MVVCKFFQQGYCRYGQNCRFEHVYGTKYSYHAPQHAAPTTTTGITDEQLVNQVQTEVQAVLKGGQWLLSSYAPFKEKPALPGFFDMSFEEARLFIYEAKASNNVDQAVAYMNNLYKEARQKYEQLLQPTTTIVKALRGLYNGEVVASPFDTHSTGFGSSNASSVFRSAAQNSSSPLGQSSNNAASIFGQKAQNVFGPSSPTPKSIFGTGSPENSAAKSIFAQATQNVFNSPTNTNVFGMQNSAQSLFSQASNQNQSQNVFASPPRDSNPTNIFASASQQFFGEQKPTADPFGQNPDPFGQKTSPFPLSNDQTTGSFKKSDPSSIFASASNAFEQQNDDTSIYSRIEEHSEEDLEAFKSNEFKLGFIPELPPPRALCA